MRYTCDSKADNPWLVFECFLVCKAYCYSLFAFNLHTSDGVCIYYIVTLT